MGITYGKLLEARGTNANLWAVNFRDQGQHKIAQWRWGTVYGYYEKGDGWNVAIYDHDPRVNAFIEVQGGNMQGARSVLGDVVGKAERGVAP